MHDFEQFEPKVVQDLFNICRYARAEILYVMLTTECSLSIPKLPITFLLALSSPPEPSYLHGTYPRATLALLRIHRITVTSQVEVVEQVLSKVYPVPRPFN